MNRRACLCLLAAATLTACGQPPSPGTPRAVPRAETTTVAPSTAQVVTPAPPPPATTTTPPKPPPRTTTKPPPPKPKPPDRWVLPAGLRSSIEEQDNQPFPQVWAQIKTQIAPECPNKKPCVGYTLLVDPTIVGEGDCYVGDKGILIPNPLHENGKITFKVNNKTDCTEV